MFEQKMPYQYYYFIITIVIVLIIIIIIILRLIIIIIFWYYYYYCQAFLNVFICMDGIRNSRKVLLKGCNLDLQKVFKILKIILHPNKSLLLNIFIWSCQERKHVS